MNYGVMAINWDEYLLNALKEDVANGDITTNSILTDQKIGKGQLISKEDGIIAGIDVFVRVFQLLDEKISFETTIKDGDHVGKGQVLGFIKGDLRAILTGERVALNYLQRMSGIATYTRRLVNQLEGFQTQILDTRKTTPNMRVFEKYAVKIGGGANHRFNLSDGILIKDNHINAAGSIGEAIALVKEHASFVRKIEIEVESLDMLEQALEAGADIIMLDNMDDITMKKAVERVAGRAITEASGNVTEERIRGIASTGVDYISIGALTHSSGILDFSLKNLSCEDFRSPS